MINAVTFEDLTHRWADMLNNIEFKSTELAFNEHKTGIANSVAKSTLLHSSSKASRKFHKFTLHAVPRTNKQTHIGNLLQLSTMSTVRTGQASHREAKGGLQLSFALRREHLRQDRMHLCWRQCNSL